MAETKITPQDEICQALAKAEPTFKMSLPPQIPSAKFIRVAQTAIRQNPALASLDRASLYAAFHRCAADGLIPDGREAAIIGFGNQAVYMPMVLGICRKARNSGKIKDINAVVVYSKDEYDRWIDEAGEHFKHRPARGEKGDPILTYAFARTIDDVLFFEEIPMDQMNEIESKSKVGWKSFRTEFMRKSAIRRLLKYRVPSSPDLDDTIRENDSIYDAPDKPATAQPTSSRLRNIVDTTTAPREDANECIEEPPVKQELPV